jgi:hypothetical protein
MEFMVCVTAGGPKANRPARVVLWSSSHRSTLGSGNAPRDAAWRIAFQASAPGGEQESPLRSLSSSQARV